MGNVNSKTFYLKVGADITVKDTNGWTPLHYAAQEGCGVAALIDRGADVHARSNDGVTPLMDATRKGHLEAARTLVAAGADVNAVDDNGYTVLMAAAFGKNELVTEYLLEVILGNNDFFFIFEFVYVCMCMLCVCVCVCV